MAGLAQTVKLILVNAEQDILLLKRSATHPTQALDYDLPGGRLEDTETPIAALVRETREETGLEVLANSLKPIYVVTTQRDENVVLRYFYAAILDQPKEILLSDEHCEYVWENLGKSIGLFRDGNYKQLALKYIADHRLLALI